MGNINYSVILQNHEGQPPDSISVTELHIVF